MPPHRLRKLQIALALVATLVGCDRADEYPSRPLLLICPWSVGGGTDRMSRTMAELLKRKLGQQVNVINATGGSGVTGHDRGARARPDGYTLLMMTVEINMLHWRGLTDLRWDDYRPLIMLNSVPAAVIVRKDAPWQDLAALTAEIERRRGELKASGTAFGGIWHLAMTGWLGAAGLDSNDVIWMPSKGAGPSLAELAGGGLDFVVCSLPEAQAQIDAGTARALGVMAPERLEHYPDVPTLPEQGIDWTLGGWRGLALPKGTPDEIFARLLATAREIVGEPDFRDYMDKQGEAIRIEPAERFEASLAVNDEKLGALLRAQFSARQPDRIGPYAFPRIIGAGLSLLAVSLLVGRVRRRRAATPALARTAPRSSAGVLRATEAVVAVGLLAALLERLGFVPVASVFLLWLQLRLRVKLPVALLVTIVLVGAIFVLFRVVLGVQLPSGVGL